MKLALDGAIYCQQKYGGITRFFNETLPRLCSLDDSMHIDIWTRGTLQQPLPLHGSIQQRTLPAFENSFWKSRIGDHFLPAMEQRSFETTIGEGRDEVWHFTYMYLGMPRRWKGPKVLTVYDLLFETFPEKYEQYWKRFMKFRVPSIRAADRIVCISETTKKDLLRFYDIDPQKVVVVPLACSSVYRKLQAGNDQVNATADKPASQMADKPFLLYVGGRYWHKNFENLLRTYARWPRRSDIDLVLVGQPFVTKELALIQELGIEGNVRLVSDADDEQLATLYNRARAHIHTSRHEGFGITLLEAMACGCPIIASRIPSTVEVAGDIPTYFESDDCDSLLAALDAGTTEPDPDREKSGIERAATYSWDATAAGMLEVYRNLLG